MSEKLAIESFRSVFKVIDKDTLRWFPGHMGRGLKQMQTKLRTVDCIIEVHDARIPLSGRNADFKYTISGGVKPHILVLNKVDLIGWKSVQRIEDRLRASDCPQHVVFTNSKSQECRGIRKLFPLVQQLIRNSDRYNRTAEDDLCAMIIGVPNVGKSSLINALRVRNSHRGNATAVGAVPGITRSVLHKIKVCEKPLCYVLDTPGILTPHIANTETGLKLALCATLQDHLVGETTLADYLLFWLNKNGHYQYVKYFGLKEANDNVLEVLAQISVNAKKMLRIRNNNNEYVLKPDFKYASHQMLKSFRDGSLGKIVLDEDLL